MIDLAVVAAAVVVDPAVVGNRADVASVAGDASALGRGRRRWRPRGHD